MELADREWEKYGASISKNFSEAVRTYRKINGRNPPPGFVNWYKFAREREVYNIDDFDQIMDDLRPFWSIEPPVLRSLAAHMHDRKADSVVGIHIRDGAVWRVNEGPAEWRTDSFVSLIKGFVAALPDMDIAVNQLDQPRVTVPWEDMQKLLAKEEAFKINHNIDITVDEFSNDKTGLWVDEAAHEKIEDPQFIDITSEPYMSVVQQACPPGSPARDNSTKNNQALYKDIGNGGLVTDFNRSVDICTVGLLLEQKHGMLFSSKNTINTKLLVPIFSESKTNVNNDILYPSTMHWDGDARYEYDDEYDYSWDDKEEAVFWRGTVTGGARNEDNYKNFQRDRLVSYVNSTEMRDKEVSILTTSQANPGTYKRVSRFQPSKFAKDHTDVAFVEGGDCQPNCTVLTEAYTYANKTTLAEQFQYRYIVDVDGDGFSPRWRALMQSQSLGIKSTIFREWHHSRLFAWRHFVPLDVSYDDLYTILTYFIGYGKANGGKIDGDNYANRDVYVQRHDFEARKMARRGREWAQKVLRREDMEVSPLISLKISFANSPC
jgi:hypothetical protein